MPEMDGIEASRQIRVTPSPYQNIPIIALTADPKADTNAAAMEAGINFFLKKPVIKAWITPPRPRAKTRTQTRS